jgi:hypothetical protein
MMTLIFSPVMSSFDLLTKSSLSRFTMATTTTTMTMTICMFLLAFVLLANVDAYQPMSGIMVKPIREASPDVDIGDWLSGGKSLVVFGTYAADFNAIEYGQRLRYYWPKLQQEKGLTKCAFILSCQPAAAKALAEQVDLPDDIEIWVDNTGQAGRAFGVERGWLPETDLNPFIKLSAMLFGLGAW